jgi:Glycosyltransferase family 92
MSCSITAVAILRAEDPFLDEWIAYHRLLGVERFVLYDDDPRQNLRVLLQKHLDYITIFDWKDGYHVAPGRNRQTRAYEHALRNTCSEWLTFIDGDEFIVLRNHDSIQEFVSDFGSSQAIVLTWHVFGHNGHFSNPKGLITESLTRRQKEPGRMTKSIVRPEYVIAVPNAHACKMRNHRLVHDANQRVYTNDPYPGKTSTAHVNHYMCRSFENWMSRVGRGEVAFTPDTYPKDAAWRYDERACLKKFVELTRTFNETVDEYMLKYGDSIRQYLARLEQANLEPIESVSRHTP